MSDLLKVKVGGSRYLCKWEKTIQVGNIKYPIVRVGDQWWITEDLKNDAGNYRIVNNVHYYYPSTDSYVALMSLFPSGWRITTYADFQYLETLYSGQFEKLCSTSGWDGLGTNESGLNLTQNGCINGYGDLINTSECWHMTQYDASRPNINNSSSGHVFYLNSGSISLRTDSLDIGWYIKGRIPLRICCNV